MLDISEMETGEKKEADQREKKLQETVYII